MDTMNHEQVSVDCLLSRSEKCLIDNNFEQAVLLCTELIARNAHLGRAYSIRAEAHVRLIELGLKLDDSHKITEQVWSDASKALELCPTDVFALNILAWYLRNRGKFDESLAMLTEAIKLDSSQLRLFANRGNSHFCACQFEEALADYTRAIAIDPNTRNLFWLRGQTYAKLRKFEHAILDFTQEIKLFPASKVYADRGRSHAQLGEYDLAISDYTESLRLSPDNAATFFDRSSCFFFQEDYERALQDLTESIRIDPSVPCVFDCRAFCHITMNKYELGLADCRSSIKLDSKRPEPHYLRAECYARMGDKVKAARACRKAMGMGSTEMPLDMMLIASVMPFEFRS